jgi:putative membrane protein
MKTLFRYLGTVAAVVLTVTIVPGVEVSGGWLTVFLIALVWSVITLVVRPVLTVLTLPITLVTFGLFAFILNSLLFWAMELVVPGFSVDGFFAALLGAIVISVISWLIGKVI